VLPNAEAWGILPVITLNFVIPIDKKLIQVDSILRIFRDCWGSTFIEQVLAEELFESARIRRLKSRGMWAMTCSITQTVGKPLIEQVIAAEL